MRLCKLLDLHKISTVCVTDNLEYATGRDVKSDMAVVDFLFF